MADQDYEGGCVCGKVRYRVSAARLADVIACHCRTCRRMSGHFFAATAVPRNAFDITEAAGLGWYASSTTSRRGFCRECGSSLFFDHRDSELIAIAAGSLDGSPSLKMVAHIYVDEAGSYYSIGDDVEQFDACLWRSEGWRKFRRS